MSISRRHWLAAVVGGLAASCGTIRQSNLAQITDLPLIVSTWPFGQRGNEKALEVLKNGGSILDGVEEGIRLVELGPNDRSVGLGGVPNAAGVAQLDACIMHGPDHRAGSVAGLEGVPHPISVARRVMEKTPHVMLVGDGARMFAMEQGLETLPVAENKERHDAWFKARLRQTAAPGEGVNHDTVTLLVLGPDRSIAGGCSTSGLGRKLPGRVGDSPIIGSGLYLDNDVGAAGATGRGENIMRYSGSYQVVENMRRGMHPQRACEDVIRRIAAKEGKMRELQIHFIALDNKGRFGAAGSSPGFAYCVTTPSRSGQLSGRDLSAAKEGL